MVVTAEQMRRQFNNRWKKNIVKVTIIRDTDIESDGFFWEDDGLDPEKRFQLDFNINGDAKGTKKRAEQGLTSDGENVSHVMVPHDWDIKATDYILMDGIKYKIEKFDTGALFKGELIFIQFDIVQIENQLLQNNLEE